MEGVLIGKSTNASRERCQRLLQRHRGIVFKVANTYCRDAEDRRDLAQEICAQVWKVFPCWDQAPFLPHSRLRLEPACGFSGMKHPQSFRTASPASGGSESGAYQTFTRCSGARYSFCSGLTSKAAYQASRLRTVSAR